MIVFRTITRAEVDTWAELCGTVFDAGKQYFINHFERDPDAREAGIWVALDDGKLVSSVRVFHRCVYISGQRVSMGGIGEVCTLPEYQKRGLSAELLKRSVGYMREQGLNISLLFTGSNNHYARQGWATFIRNNAKVDLSAAGTLP